MNQFLLIIRKRVYLILFCFIGMSVLGVVYNVMSKKVYKTSFFIRYNSPVNPECYSFAPVNPECYSFAELKKIVDDFYNYLKTESMNTDFELSKKVKKTTLSLTKREDQSQEVLILLYDTSAIEYFQKSILGFINNQNYVKRRIEQERKTMISTLEKMNEALQKMEERKKTDNANQLLFNIDRDILDLKINKNLLENNINNLHGYEITVGPTLPESPYDFPPMIAYPVFSLSGLLLGILLALLFEKGLHL